MFSSNNNDDAEMLGQIMQLLSKRYARNTGLEPTNGLRNS